MHSGVSCLPGDVQLFVPEKGRRGRGDDRAMERAIQTKAKAICGLVLT